MIHYRLPVAALTLTAAALGVMYTHEDYVTVATVPTKNDRCTNGFGSTVKEDGTRIKCGESVTPVQAVRRSLVHIAKEENVLRKCVTGDMSTPEFDLLMDFTYQFGSNNACKSSMVKHINAGEYVKACQAYTLYKYSGGFDCSTPGNKICSGVWKRQLERRDKCLAVQKGIVPLNVPKTIPVDQTIVDPIPNQWWRFWS